MIDFAVWISRPRCIDHPQITLQSGRQASSGRGYTRTLVHAGNQMVSTVLYTVISCALTTTDFDRPWKRVADTVATLRVRRRKVIRAP